MIHKESKQNQITKKECILGRYPGSTIITDAKSLSSIWFSEWIIQSLDLLKLVEYTGSLMINTNKEVSLYYKPSEPLSCFTQLHTCSSS